MSAVIPRPSRKPALYGDRTRWALVHGDSLDLLAGLPADSADSLVCDPPYGISFAGEAWDGGELAGGEGFQHFTAMWGAAAHRVMKPGAWGAVSCAARTVHRLVCGLEEAGFEVRDQLCWCSPGVPKTTAGLRPMYEPIILIRKPLSERTLSANVTLRGTGALSIEDARIPRASDDPGARGYHPGNLALTHDPRCASERGECVVDCPTALIERIEANPLALGRPFSRLLHVSKASRAEREAGLEDLPATRTPIFSGSLSRPRANLHPTVKPLALMRHLVKLVTPPGARVVLDPFTGSGSTGIAAMLEGRQFFGIEREDAYVAIARARLTHWAAVAAQQAPSQTDPGGAA